jgi:hypothetical protein
VVSGGGTIEKLQHDGGITLNNPANSFSGGLVIRAGDQNWNAVTINASGAMGTGPVSVYGGPVSTNLSNPGGLTFGNAATHTNPITLYGTAPISASGAVTLNGQPPPQQVTLFSCSSVAGEENLDAWTAYGEGLAPYRTHVRRIGNNVVLLIFRSGALISVK